MGMDTGWLEKTGLDVQKGLAFTGGEVKYLSALQRFFKNYEKNKSKVEEYYHARDYESYMITVHALKSNAKMIGATKLAEDFEALENAAGNQDMEWINGSTETVMADYGALISALSPIGDMGDVRAADEIGADVARETAKGILEALDDFDDEGAKALAKKLAGYPFRMTQADRLKEAIGFIEDFMYDEAAEIINEIMPAIE